MKSSVSEDAGRVGSAEICVVTALSLACGVSSQSDRQADAHTHKPAQLLTQLFTSIIPSLCTQANKIYRRDVAEGQWFSVFKMIMRWKNMHHDKK